MPSEPQLLTLWLLQLTVLQGAANAEAVCGQPVLSSRIAGGQDSSEGAWPWQVSVLQDGTHACGGSLINEQWVVSAAHCFVKTDSQYEVQLGAYQLYNPSNNSVTLSVQCIISHPDYNGNEGSSGDIALLKLSSPVTFTNYILPVCLPQSSIQFSPKANCWVTGWGHTQSEVDLKPPKTLQELEVPLIDRDTCNSLYNTALPPDLEPNPIKPDMFCAGYPEGGKDACQGDSGGPLVCKCESGWTLAGVVSWGEGCAQRSFPGVYTSVPYYANWINETAEGRSGLQNTPAVALLLVSLAMALP